MAKRGGGGTDAQLERLKEIKANPSSPDAARELSKALRGKSNVLAAKAADIVAAAKIAGLESVLIEAFNSFLVNADRGCVAKTAIAKALLALESRADDVLLVGARHVQHEPTFGGQSDAAIELRCVCCAALVNMRSRKAMRPLVHLLADEDAGARSAALTALIGYGGDAVEALLRYKALIGDEDVLVMGTCFAGLTILTRSTEAVEPYLESEDEELRDAAMLAIGESKLPAAFEVLRARWDRNFDAESRGVLCLALALTRRSESVDFLIEQIAHAGPKVAVGAVEALAMYRGDELIRSKVAAAARERDGEASAEFNRRFG